MVHQDKLHSGEIYDPSEFDLQEAQNKHLEMLYDFNHTRPKESEKRQALLKEMFAEIGENCYIEPPLHANWGGYHTHFGDNVYVNFNLTLVDDTHIYVGDNVMMGPNVVISSGTHPLEPSLREKGLQYNLPIHIERNVWLGAGVIIMPGVTIGENSVIGAGSVVTKDIPANVVAVGSPCRVLREITDADIDKYSKKNK